MGTLLSFSLSFHVAVVMVSSSISLSSRSEFRVAKCNISEHLSISEKILSDINVVVSRQVKRENSSLPVAVRVSKTHVFQLPINEPLLLLPINVAFTGCVLHSNP